MQPLHLTQEGVFDALKFVKVTRLELDDHAVREKISTIASLPQRHHLAGLITESALFATLPDEMKDEELARPLVVYPWGWPGLFGASLTLSILVAGATSFLSRIAIPQLELEGIQHLLTEPFTLVLLRGRRAIAAYHVDFAANPKSLQNLRSHIDSVLAHADIILNDDMLHYWEVLSHQEAFRDQLTSSDLLSLGWYDDFANKAKTTDAWIKDAKERLPRPNGDWIPAKVTDLLAELFTESHGLDHILQYLHVTLDGVGASCVSFVHELLKCLPKLGEHHEELTHLIAMLFDLHRSSSRLTDCGKQVAWYDFRSDAFKQLLLLPNQFPTGCNPQEYWPRIRWDFLNFGFGIGVNGGDFPINPHSLVQEIASMPLATEAASVSASADALMEEAVENKIGTIPPNAYVDLSFGPFTHLELTESDPNVFFVCRNSLGEFLQVLLEPRKDYCSFKMPPVSTEENDDEIEERINAGVKILLAAIVRDFWVVEKRETVFSSSSRPSSGSRNRSDDDETPRVVYVPRIRYEQKADPDKCVESLGHTERRSHKVRGFVRKVSRPSPHQLILAERYGIDVPTGYTFVRPHDRGKTQRAVIYRSRSALQCLYVSQDVATGSTPSLWFQFECDVRRMMEQLGFNVQHVSLSRHGDNGIDVYATKGIDLEAVEWVIQCKCWRSNRKVYPATVRELLGTLQRYPRGTRGMIVTTSRFSSGSVTTAQESNIRLVDGEEFARMIQ